MTQPFSEMYTIPMAQQDLDQLAEVMIGHLDPMTGSIDEDFVDRTRDLVLDQVEATGTSDLAVAVLQADRDEDADYPDAEFFDDEDPSPDADEPVVFDDGEPQPGFVAHVAGEGDAQPFEAEAEVDGGVLFDFGPPAWLFYNGRRYNLAD